MKNIKISKKSKKNLYIDNFSDIVIQFIESAERFKTQTDYVKGGMPFEDHSIIRLRGHRAAGHTTAALEAGTKLATRGSKVLLVSNSFSMIQHQKHMLVDGLIANLEDLKDNFEFRSVEEIITYGKLRGTQFDYAFITDSKLPYYKECRLIDTLISYLVNGEREYPGTIIFL